jgi:hypothetical protein
MICLPRSALKSMIFATPAWIVSVAATAIFWTAPAWAKQSSDGDNGRTRSVQRLPSAAASERVGTPRLGTAEPRRAEPPKSRVAEPHAMHHLHARRSVTPADAIGIDWEQPAPSLVSYDLQLVAVRLVDPGQPEQQRGPCYRIWIRNNSSLAAPQPFTVMLLAGNDARLVRGLPQTSVRVTSIAAGDTQAVDLRLPTGVFTMGRDSLGRPLPYNMIHVAVDTEREVPDACRANNAAMLAVADVLPAAMDNSLLP